MVFEQRVVKNEMSRRKGQAEINKKLQLYLVRQLEIFVCEANKNINISRKEKYTFWGFDLIFYNDLKSNLVSKDKQAQTYCKFSARDKKKDPYVVLFII